eukprot:5146990-Ditylum_brightwellii.AAC.1
MSASVRTPRYNLTMFNFSRVVSEGFEASNTSIRILSKSLCGCGSQRSGISILPLQVQRKVLMLLNHEVGT